MAPRASTRLKGQPRVSLAETSSDNEHKEFVESNATPPAKPTRSKKRKTSETTKVGKAVRTSKTQQNRGNRGLLRALVEMPLDILFEIFGCLEPLDLLQLSQTSKALRALLMKRSALSVWKRSFSNVPYPAPPPCPGDLNEPQYAELVFGKTCHFCGKRTGMIHRVWAARVRVCTKCLDTHFEELVYDTRSYGDDLFEFVPTLELHRKCGRHARGKLFIYPPIDRAWLEAYEGIDSTLAKRRWVEEKIKEQEVISYHAEACTDWESQVEAVIESVKETAIERRKELVIQHIYHLGWGDELEILPDDSYRPEDLPIVQKACRKDLTEAVLASLDEHLIAFMEEAKATRLKLEHHSVVEPRLNDLDEVIDECMLTLPANSIYPTPGELFRLPFIQDIIATLPKAASFSDNVLDSIKLSLNKIIQQWKTVMELKLRDMASKAHKDAVDPEIVLGLATTFFCCTHCSYSRFLRYPNVLMHRCATKPHNLAKLDGDLDVQYLNVFRGETYWNYSGGIVMKPEHKEFMDSVVFMAGLDPKTATVQDMDAVNPIFECIPCNSVIQGRATMSWMTTLSHASDCYAPHSRFPSSSTDSLHMPTLLDESEAEVIRPRIREESERRLRAPPYGFGGSEMVCTICKQRSSFKVLWHHMKTNHGKAKPAKGDIAPVIDSDNIPPVHRHWPPRDDDEEDEGGEEDEEDFGGEELEW